MVGGKTSFGEKFLNIATGQRKSQIPSHGARDHRGFEGKCCKFTIPSLCDRHWNAQTIEYRGNGPKHFRLKMFNASNLQHIRPTLSFVRPGIARHSTLHPMATNNNGLRVNAGHQPIGVKMDSLNGSIHHHNPQRTDENAFTVQPTGGSQQSDHNVGSPPELVGSDLLAADYAALESRWIDRALADRAGLRRVDSLTGGEVIGRKGAITRAS
jgi:hypothetical protein